MQSKTELEGADDFTLVQRVKMTWLVNETVSLSICQSLGVHRIKNSSSTIKLNCSVPIPSRAEPFQNAVDSRLQARGKMSFPICFILGREGSLPVCLGIDGIFLILLTLRGCSGRLRSLSGFPSQLLNSAVSCAKVAAHAA